MSDLHSKYDNKGSMMNISKTIEFSVFGDYSDAPWNIFVGAGKSSKEAFLFGLRCDSGLTPTKITLKPGNNENAVYHSYDYGTLFGSVLNLCISHYSCPDLNKVYSNIGNMYKLPNGASNTFLTGKSGNSPNNVFKVSEVEVLKV